MKYIIDIPNELAEATARYWNETTDMTLVPYTEPDRKAIEDEVWENTWKMFMTPEDFGATMGDSYSEAKAKYDAWKEQKEEIHVGDEVQYSLAGYEYTFIVFGKENDTLYGIRTDEVDMDDIYAAWDYCHKSDSTLVKTGRHFDEVDELLKKMRGE